MTVCLQMSAVDFMEEDRDVRKQKLVLCSLIAKWSMHMSSDIRAARAEAVMAL